MLIKYTALEEQAGALDVLGQPYRDVVFQEIAHALGIQRIVKVSFTVLRVQFPWRPLLAEFPGYLDDGQLPEFFL